MKLVVATFSQKKVLLGAFTVIVKTSRGFVACSARQTPQVSAVILPGSRETWKLMIVTGGHNQTHAGSNSISSRSPALQLTPTIANIRWLGTNC